MQKNKQYKKWKNEIKNINSWGSTGGTVTEYPIKKDKNKQEKNNNGK